MLIPDPLAPASADGALLEVVQPRANGCGFRSRVYRFPVDRDFDTLPEFVIAGERWRPMCGNKVSARQVAAREAHNRIIGFAQWEPASLIVGRIVEYWPTPQADGIGTSV